MKKDIKILSQFFIGIFLVGLIAIGTKATERRHFTEADLTLQDGDLRLFSQSYLKFLCSVMDKSQQKKCLEIGVQSLEESSQSNMTSVRRLRSQALAFMSNTEFLNLVLVRILGDSKTENFRIREKIWQEFGVVVLPGGFVTPIGNTGDWKLDDLKLLYAGYLELKRAIGVAVGPSRISLYSHIWGAGGSIARLGKKTVNGQFGEVWSHYPAQINVVVSLTAENFTAATVAQRLAHENAHSQDGLLGISKTGRRSYWSERQEAKIFRFCQLPPSYETSLQACRARHPEWFNFHPTNYSASNSAEFYSKMVDEWVRENLGLVPNGRYKSQSSVTSELWNEMAGQFLGL